MFFLPLERFPKAKHLQPKVRALPPALLSAAAAHQGSQGEGIRAERLCRVCWKRNDGFFWGKPWVFRFSPSIYSFVTLPTCNPWWSKILTIFTHKTGWFLLGKCWSIYTSSRMIDYSWSITGDAFCVFFYPVFTCEKLMGKHDWKWRQTLMSWVRNW